MKKIITMGLCFALILSLAGCGRIKHPAVQEYIPGRENIRENADASDFYERDKHFEIGATKEGCAVFKNPDDAYYTLLKKYSAGLSLIQKEFGLEPISQKNYQIYKFYGRQVKTGTDEEQAQARFISAFFDIYENSYN